MLRTKQIFIGFRVFGPAEFNSELCFIVRLMGLRFAHPYRRPNRVAFEVKIKATTVNLNGFNGEMIIILRWTSGRIFGDGRTTLRTDSADGALKFSPDARRWRKAYCRAH